MMTVDTFKREVGEAMRNYDRHIVCLEKTPDEFEAAVKSLLAKAIKAFESRGDGMRHGIALDRQVTVILSQGDGPRPLCGIYFNLHSPYNRENLPKTVKPLMEKSPKSESPKSEE